jgi:alpha-beta hydrolase superfamily lysophospholipase
VSEEELIVRADDGFPLFVRRWNAPGSPRAVVQIAHGMAEHGGRYAALASALNDIGATVIAGDHRGHGRSINESAPRGHFNDHRGWEKAVGDLHHVREQARPAGLDVPHFLLGHSLGSFLAQQYITVFGAGLDGVILSAGNGAPRGRARHALWVARLEKLIKGSRRQANWMHRLTFGEFNRPFRPSRTGFDWLSRDETIVDAYIRDPDCGFVCTTALWADFLAAARTLLAEEALAAVDRDLPVLIVSGTRDPVGEFGQGVRRLHEAYLSAGFRDVTCKLYDDARHEVLNETNREEVISDVISWIDRVLLRQASAIAEETPERDVGT